MKNSLFLKRGRPAVFGLAILVSLPVVVTKAADISWTDGTASYTNAANWTGGIVPGVNDNAINDNGSNNAVQINLGNPDWSLNQIRAGNGVGNGAFEQNGQSVTLTGTNFNGSVASVFSTPLRLGVAAGETGVYTLNGGSINYSNGGFNVGEFGTGILNINGGTITGSGNFAANLGTHGTPTAVNATVGGSLGEGDFTWFEQGYYAPNGAIGLPAPGSTIVSISQADHSFTLAPSYTANNAVVVAGNITSATITPTSPTACSGLSFLCDGGSGASTVNYTVHHADSTTEGGSLTIPDWFGPSTAQEVMAVGGRSDALGVTIQLPGNVTPFVGNAPYLWSLDIPVSNTGSAVTSIDLTYASGGVASVLAVSSSTGGGFTPMAMTGYNRDIIVEAGAVSVVSGSVTDRVTQTNGAVNITGAGLLFIGNYGTGIYNLSGGSVSVNNNISVGRNGGNGTLNLSGGILSESGGSFRIGDVGVGVLTQTGGTLITTNNEFWIGQSPTGNGTYNLSAGTMICSNWLAVGREGAAGVLNISGGSITKAGGGNITITHGTGASGTVNQTGGTITCASGQTWIGEDNGTATWNISAGTANLAVVHIVQNASASGFLNLNGGLMTAQEITTGNAGGVSTLTFNGGTLQAAASNPTFLHDITVVNVSSGGAIFDSAGFDITVSQAMPNNGGDGSGGLTKNGAGTLTLSGANSYVGPTVVNAGAVATTTASAGGGDYTLANGTALGVQVVGSLNSQLSTANLTLGTSAATTLNFDLGSFGNPSLAPLNVAGTLAANGTVTVNVADALPQLGQFPLIKYGSKTGSGSFVMGSLPIGVTASISNNVANQSIDLVISGVNVPRWEGLAGGNWDIGVTTNWINVGTGLPTFYTEGSQVQFNDSALGTTTVNLTTTVHPTVITMTNSTLNYTFAGSGSVAGSIGLNKQGSATLSLLNNNSYTGPTVISGGTLIVTNLANGGSPSPIGASSANPTNLVLNSGTTFQYAGAPVSVNRGYTVQGSNSILSAQGNLALGGLVTAASSAGFTKAGPAQLAYTTVGSNLLSGSAGYVVQNGTVLFDGSAGSQTNVIQGTLRVCDATAANAGISITSAVVNVTGAMELGNSNTALATLNLNSNALLIVQGNPFAVGRGPSTGAVVQAAGTLDCKNELWIGQGTNGVGSYTFSGGTMLNSNWVAIGRQNATGYMAMTSGTLTRGGAGSAFIIGTGAGNNGLHSSGTFDFSGGTLNCFNEYWIAENTGTTGTNNISGTAVLNLNNWMSIGRGGTGVVNFTSGTINRQGAGSAFIVGDGGTGFFFHSGGALTSANELWVGQGGSANGRYDLSGTGSIAVNNWVAIGRGGGTGTFNMLGGTFTKTGNGGNHFIVGAGGPGTLNQSGGTLTSVLSDSWIGESATATWNLSGGAAVMSVVHISQNSGVIGTLNLSGGTLTATEVTMGNSGGRGTLNFNGGTLIAANGANPNFLHGLATNNVMSGGAVIDSGTNVINASQNLLDGGGGGGLTKNGAGTLRLNGVNTYTGTTLVNAGTLGGSGTIAGPLNVAATGTLAPGNSIGTLTVNNNATLGGTTVMEISKDGGVPASDLLAVSGNLAYGGTLTVVLTGTNTLAVNDTFNLFDWGTQSGSFTATNLPAGYLWDTSQLNVNGTIRVVAVSPARITSSGLSGGNLILQGVGGPAGASYSWLTSTNVMLPITSWTTNSTGVFDSNGNFSNAFPTTTFPARFFRLKTP